MNKTLVIAAGIVALVGLIVNAAVDFDNVYDMTLAGLWLVTLILAFLGAFIGQNKTASDAEKLKGSAQVSASKP